VLVLGAVIDLIVKVHVGAVDIRDQLELVLQRFADVVRLTT